MACMRILFLTKYTRLGASSRLRTFQFIPHFEAYGMKCEISSLFDDAYLREVYKSKTHNKWKALRSFFKRLMVLFRVRSFDHVIIEKELFPYFPPWGERFLAVLGVRYWVDYDDAIWHNYDVSSNFFVRVFLQHKINVVMRLSKGVVAGNDYIASYAVKAGSQHVVKIPTVINHHRYPIKRTFNQRPLVIGWIGSPITAKYLTRLVPILKPFVETGKIQLRLIGAGETFSLGLNEEVLLWKEDREAEDIVTFDVGIMPLEDNIWERGKCGYKLIQYMGCGLPVIGTPIGVNKQLIEPGINGWHATTLEEWTEAFSQLLENPEQLLRMGNAGRKKIEEAFTLERASHSWWNILH